MKNLCVITLSRDLNFSITCTYRKCCSFEAAPHSYLLSTSKSRFNYWKLSSNVLETYNRRADKRVYQAVAWQQTPQKPGLFRPRHNNRLQVKKLELCVYEDSHLSLVWHGPFEFDPRDPSCIITVKYVMRQDNSLVIFPKQILLPSKFFWWKICVLLGHAVKYAEAF